ncbi:MAG: hypothetical protein ACLUQK_07545 [Clostridium sp.]
MLAITNGKIVQEHKILEGYALLIEQSVFMILYRRQPLLTWSWTRLSMPMEAM